MVARRRSKSPSGRSGARDAGVLIVTQPPATVFQTQVSGNGTQDSSTMLCLTVQLGPDEHASVRGLKSAGIKEAGLIVAELYRFDHARVPVYCPEKKTMVGLRVPQAVFEFDVESSAPTMLLRCRRKHLPVSKNYGGAPFRFVLHFATTGTAVSTDPFVIASKQPQPKQTPKRKRKRSEMLPYPEQDTVRDVAIQRALQGACDECSGPATGGCGQAAASGSSSSGASGAHSSHGDIVLSRLGAGGDAGPRPSVSVRASTAATTTTGIHVPTVGGGVPQGMVGLFPATMAPLVVGSGAAHSGSAQAPPRPRKRRRVSVNPDAQVMGMGHSGCDECTATRAVSSGVSVPRDALVTEPADAFARILVGESKRPSMQMKMKMKMSGGAGHFGAGAVSTGMGMGPGLGLALGPCSSRRMSMCSADGAPGVGACDDREAAVGGCDDDGQGSTASGGQSSQGTAEEAALVTLTSYRSPGRGQAARVSVPMEEGCDECDEGVIGGGADDPWSDEVSDVASVGSPRTGGGPFPYSSSGYDHEGRPGASGSAASFPHMSLPVGVGVGVASSASSSSSGAGTGVGAVGDMTPMRGVSIPGRGAYPQGSPILLAGRMAPQDSCASVATDGGL